MPARTLTADKRAWDRVADAVLKRRLELDLTAVDVVERAGRGLSPTVLSLIENSHQTSYSLRTLAALCRGLRWTSDSIERIIAGKDPTPDDSQPETREEKIARLEREMAAIRSERAQRDAGWPELETDDERKIWQLMVESPQGYSVEDIWKVIDELRRIEGRSNTGTRAAG